MASKDGTAPAPKNAFAIMMKPAAPASGSGASKDKGKGKVVAGKGQPGAGPAAPAAPVFAAKSTFKGSGLGAGPKHSLDIDNQPWVEK